VVIVANLTRSGDDRGMRRPLIPALAIAIAGLLAIPASADFHRVLVTEIQLEGAGNPAAQFVELRDPVNEGFNALSEPYEINIYDASGANVGSTTLDRAALDATTTNEFLVANPAHGPADAVLNGSFPPGSGTVCFTHGPGDERVSCVSYGCVTAPGSIRTPAPAAGQTLSRQGNTSGFDFAAPTPDAANATGSPARCTSDGPGPGGGKGDDKTDPDLALGGKKRQDVDKLTVVVTSNEAATAVMSGSVTVPGASAKVKVRKVTKSVAANVKTRIRVKLKKRAKRRVKSALGDGKKSSAKLKVVLTDGAGNSTTDDRKIKLRD
jgi:hypothetical protein